MVFEKKKFLVVVKTYPNPSRKYQETVCVAGVLLDDPLSWIRLYPVQFRDLQEYQKFPKYSIIEASISKNPKDIRPESFRVKADSIKIIEKVDAKQNWRKRKEYLFPLLGTSMCEIQQERERSFKSLGMFKPSKIEDFVIEPEKSKDWNNDERNLLSQGNLFNPGRTPLEKIPYKFKIHYFCSYPPCKGHTQTIIDWETAQLYRNAIKQHSEPIALQKVRDKYMNEIFGPQKDFYLIVGNQFKGPLSFLILSVFWPPVVKQLPLF